MPCVHGWSCPFLFPRKEIGERNAPLQSPAVAPARVATTGHAGLPLAGLKRKGILTFACEYTVSIIHRLTLLVFIFISVFITSLSFPPQKQRNSSFKEPQCYSIKFSNFIHRFPFIISVSFLSSRNTISPIQVSLYFEPL
jgi:hypothetical protein